jgi:hypothetical protein
MADNLPPVGEIVMNDQQIAVVVESPALGNYARIVLLDGSAGRQRALTSGYAQNRGWYVREEFQLLKRELTDTEGALAMRILLTGYIPGVDDEEGEPC